MGIKRRRSATEWTDAILLKRYTGSDWTDVTVSRRYNGSEWKPLWRPAGTYTGSYTPTEYASYYMSDSQRITSGIPSANGMPVIIQGSSTGKASGIVSTMLFFPSDTIMDDLYDSTILSASLELTCIRSSSSVTGTYLLLHYGGGITACPQTWDGTDSGDADSGTPRIFENGTVSVALNSAVSAGLRSGKVKYIALNAAGLSDSRYYGQFDASSVRLNIQYKYT